MNFVTGSVQVLPISNPSRSLRFGWTATTGSLIISTPNRCGELVRSGGRDEIWLVKETVGQVHTLVNERNDEREVGEDSFWPWGTWQKLTG